MASFVRLQDAAADDGHVPIKFSNLTEISEKQVRNRSKVQ